MCWSSWVQLSVGIVNSARKNRQLVALRVTDPSSASHDGIHQHDLGSNMRWILKTNNGYPELSPSWFHVTKLLQKKLPLCSPVPEIQKMVFFFVSDTRDFPCNDISHVSPSVVHKVCHDFYRADIWIPSRRKSPAKDISSSVKTSMILAAGSKLSTPNSWMVFLLNMIISVGHLVR